MWYEGDLPSYIPVCRKSRQTEFARAYPLEMWTYNSMLKDYGEGVRDWVKEAVSEGRTLAMHFFIPGTKLDRIYLKQRGLWYKAWRSIAPFIQFSIYPEFDAWYDSSLMVGRRLQYRSLELGKDMHAAGIPMVWLLLDIKAGGEDDLKFYAGRANDENMRWCATNLQGARDQKTFKAMLQVLAAYHLRLNKSVGIIVNGPGSEARIRTLLRLFEGREVVFCNASRIERLRRLM